MTAAEGRGPRSGWQRVRPVLMLVLLVATGWALAQQAPAMSRALATTQVHWGWMAAATAVVLATYALLIQGWRLLLGGWGGTRARSSLPPHCIPRARWKVFSTRGRASVWGTWHWVQK